MLNLNRAMVLGNATRDAELRYIPSGQAVAHFSVATNRRWTNQAGEAQEQVEYHEIVAWGKLAEIVSQLIKRGTKVYVEGRLQTRQWEGQDGGKRQRTEIIAENIISLSPRTETSGSLSAEAPGAKADEYAQTAPPEDYDQTKSSVASAKDDQTKSAKKPATVPASDKEEAKVEDLAKEADEINLDEIPF